MQENRAAPRKKHGRKRSRKKTERGTGQERVIRKGLTGLPKGVGNVASNERTRRLNLSCTLSSVCTSFKLPRQLRAQRADTHTALLLLPPVSNIFLFGQRESCARAHATTRKLKRNCSQPPHSQRDARPRHCLPSIPVQKGTFQYTRVRGGPAL